jgi:hypothetical protein
MFYSYAVPEPPGFRDAPVAPSEASYNPEMGEFVVPYEAVRTSEHPDEVLMSFLESTYTAAANLGGWDRVLLEQRPPCACDLQETPSAPSGRQART